LIYTGFKKYFQSKNKEHIILYNEENKANNKKGIFDELLINNWIATATVMVRADYLFKYADYKIYTFREFPMADYPAWLDLAYNTSFGCINEPMAVHRILSNSASHSTSAKKRVDFIEASYRIQKYFIQKYTIPEQTIKAVNIKINKKRLQYAFFIKDIQVSHYSKKELKKLGYNLSIREKLYYYSLKSRPLSYLLRKLFIFLGVWI